MAEYDDAPKTGEHDELFLHLRKCYDKDIVRVQEWRKEAKEDFQFFAGDQWSEDDKNMMRAKNRPPVVFNRIAPIVNAVVGSEINNRREVQYIPREVGDAQANEILTAAGEWFRDQTGAEDEESDAFEDTVVAGMGWCLSDDALVRIPNAHFATTRKFTGNVVKIDLENGKSLTGTPNHPVLTDIGWKRLCDLKEGDNLINSGFLEGVEGFPIEQFDKVETRLKDVIDAFRAGRESRRFVTSADDFYSDGAGSKVHIVYADRLLLDKLDHVSRLQHRKDKLFIRRHIESLFGVRFFGDRLLDGAGRTTKRNPTFNVGLSPRLHLSCGDIVSKLVSRCSQAFADCFTAQAQLCPDFIGGKTFLEIESGEFLNRMGRDATRGRILSRAQSVSGAHEPGRNAATAYSNLIADFFDWKPLLEVEARKLGSCDAGPSQFVTRVKSRVIEHVSDFDVHDIGTSLGMFIAGDIITSNTDTRLDFEEDPDGAPKIERIDPMEMVWDCNASKPNLQDAERMYRVKEFTYTEAKQLFPNVDKGMLNAEWARSGSLGSPHDQDRADDYDGTQGEFGDDQLRGNCLIVECRWLEREPFYRGPDPITGEVKEYSEKQVGLLRKLLPEFPVVRQTRKVVRRAFLGKTILGKPDKPLAPPGMFGWECMTGYRDKDKGQFYGVVRAAKDPQRWTNKFFSQVMFLLNSQSKGGIAAERKAFEDPRQAEASWAKSDEITWMADNALSGPNPKIMPKAPAQFPAGFFTLFQESKEEITQVTGLSPEFIGTREVDQAGVLEMQRRQSSLNLLASLFNSLRRYRKRQGKTMLFLIQEHLSDGRLIRIVGDDKKQYVPLTKENISSSTYDIIVDDVASSPNEKERVWGILTQLMPMVKDLLTPETVLELLKYSPLPASMVDNLQKRAQQAQQEAAQKPSPEEIEMQARQAEFQMDMQGKAADIEAQREKNGMDAQMKVLDYLLKEREAQLKLEGQQAQLNTTLTTAAVKSQVARQNANARQTSAAK